MHDLDRHRARRLPHFVTHGLDDRNHRAITRILVELVSHRVGFFRVGNPGNRGPRCNLVGVRHHHGHRHGATGRQPADVNTLRIDRIVLLDFLDDLPQILDLASSGVYFAVEPPAPAIAVAQAAVAGDERVGDEKTLAIGQLVESGYLLDIAVILPASVQHQQQRPRALFHPPGRHVNQVTARARTGVCARAEAIAYIVRQRLASAFAPGGQRRLNAPAKRRPGQLLQVGPAKKCRYFTQGVS